MKKTLILIIAIIMLMIPINTSASGLAGPYYPPADSKYFSKKLTFGFYSSPEVRKIRLELYGTKKTYATKIFKVKGNSTIWVDISCPGDVAVQFLNSKGKIVDSTGFGDTYPWISKKSCKYKSFAKLSNYDPKKGKYKK